MKKIVLVLAMMMPMAMAMMAQEEMKAPHMPDGQDRIERMSKELNLTPAQREKVSKIFLDESKQMRKMSEKMMKEHEKAQKKVMKVLTPEQQLKYGKMMEHQGRRPMGMGPDKGLRPDGKMGPRHGDKKGPRHDGKMGPNGKKGPRHDGQRPEFDGKMPPRPEGGQLPPPPSGDDVKIAD